MTEQSCKSCFYWKQDEGQASGDCKRYPPPKFSSGKAYAWPPTTHEDDWCGEFKQRSEEKQDPVLLGDYACCSKCGYSGHLEETDHHTWPTPGCLLEHRHWMLTEPLF